MDRNARGSANSSTWTSLLKRPVVFVDRILDRVVERHRDSRGRIGRTT